MHRPGPLALLSVQLLALVACPNEQVNPGISAGYSSGVTTAPLTSADPSTSSAASTGSDGVPTEASTGSDGAGASSGTGTDGTSSTGTSSTGMSGSSTGDSGLAGTSEASTGEPPLLLDCFGCLCDVNTSFCRKVFAGVQGAAVHDVVDNGIAVMGPDPECPIVDVEGQESGCVLYPESCDPPSCECIPTMNGSCFCSLIEQGSFQVVCPLP